MTVLNTVLILVGIPALVVVFIVGLVYASPARPRNKRYRPGREFDFAPVWFLSRPQDVSIAGAADYVEHHYGDDAPKAIESGPSGARTGVKGGASGSW